MWLGTALDTTSLSPAPDGATGLGAPLPWLHPMCREGPKLQWGLCACPQREEGKSIHQWCHVLQTVL